jgi:hypothetical protein
MLKHMRLSLRLINNRNRKIRNRNPQQLILKQIPTPTNGNMIIMSNILPRSFYPSDLPYLQRGRGFILPGRNRADGDKKLHLKD